MKHADQPCQGRLLHRRSYELGIKLSDLCTVAALALHGATTQHVQCMHSVQAIWQTGEIF